ncbi:MAG: hypothetical protein KGZ62_11130 [Sulfurimonas sp.]|nr:hypothetical protein [Sulfurimonas sp.]
MRNFFVFITIIVIVHYFYFLFGFTIGEQSNINFYSDSNITLEKKGVFGDYTSGHFSILAFLWLAYGIMIQSREFKLQREEFTNQTEQFKEQNSLYSSQLKELEKQSFENKFDRYIQKLTDLEVEISSHQSNNTNRSIYEFITHCEKSNSLHLETSKIITIEKYISLYNKVSNSVEDDIELKDELIFLKKDIYDGMIFSYLALLLYVIRSTTTHQIELSAKKIHELKQLSIYKTVSNIYTNRVSNVPNEYKYAFEIIDIIINEFGNLDKIDIFEVEE